MVRREKFGEVVKLLHWINSKNRKDNGLKANDRAWRDKDGNLHIRRQATNDSWY